MLASLLAAWRLPELRNRIKFLFGMLAVYVIGLHIPVPGIDRAAMERLFAGGGGALGFLDVFTGGALKKYTIFAMGIAPYINASIIMQLLTMAIPSLEAMQKEGESGRKRISQITRYLTIGLAFLQAFGLNQMFKSQNVLHADWLMMAQIMITVTAGTAFLMWMGEQITDRGVGNGVSIVIFAGIVASIPGQLAQTWEFFVGGSITIVNIAIGLILFLGTVVGIVAIQQAQRKIPIQHVRRVVGQKIYEGSTSYLPLRVNSAGVIPIIFALSLQLLPMTVAQFVSPDTTFGALMQRVAKWSSPGDNAVAAILYALLIMGFTYFYTAIQFNAPDVAENLKKYGSFIPGIRPGQPTLEYIDKIVSRLTLAGAVFLALIALLQYYSPAISGVQTFQLVGGTSLLIVVGVALETMQAIEAHLVMRNYEGFIK